jgi:hypothetical protein
MIILYDVSNEIGLSGSNMGSGNSRDSRDCKVICKNGAMMRQVYKEPPAQGE